VRPVKITPHDMMFVPHNMKMDLKTTSSGQFNVKKSI